MGLTGTILVFPQSGTPPREPDRVARGLIAAFGYSGRTICTTWRVIAFSFGDARYDPEIHKIRNNQHAIFGDLAEVFSSPTAWDVQIG